MRLKRELRSCQKLKKDVVVGLGPVFVSTLGWNPLGWGLGGKVGRPSKSKRIRQALLGQLTDSSGSLNFRDIHHIGRGVSSNQVGCLIAAQ